MDPVNNLVFGNEVGATTVTTLVSRARDAKRFHIKDWHDEQAEAVLQRLEEHSKKPGYDIDSLCLTDKKSVAGTIRRSQGFDTLCREFCAQHSSQKPLILSLGIGLCNRASRLADLDVQWWGIDQESVISLRRELIPEDTVQLIAADITKTEDWISTIPSDQPTLVIAEGLVMYFTAEQVAAVMKCLRKHFPTVEFAADSFDLGVIDHKVTDKNISKRTGASYTFSCAGAEGLASLAPGWTAEKTIDQVSPVGVPHRIGSSLYRATHHGRPPYFIAHVAAMPSA